LGFVDWEEGWHGSIRVRNVRYILREASTSMYHFVQHRQSIIVMKFMMQTIEPPSFQISGLKHHPFPTMRYWYDECQTIVIPHTSMMIFAFAFLCPKIQHQSDIYKTCRRTFHLPTTPVRKSSHVPSFPLHFFVTRHVYCSLLEIDIRMMRRYFDKAFLTS